jgi:hypothetical protein
MDENKNCLAAGNVTIQEDHAIAGFVSVHTKQPSLECAKFALDPISKQIMPQRLK